MREKPEKEGRLAAASPHTRQGERERERNSLTSVLALEHRHYRELWTPSKGPGEWRRENETTNPNPKKGPPRDRRRGEVEEREAPERRGGVV